MAKRTRNARRGPPQRASGASLALASTKAPTDERGSTGTVSWGGVLSGLQADYAEAWQLPTRWTTIEKMVADPAVTATLAALTYPILAAPLEVEAASDDPDDKRYAEFVEENLNGMTTTLARHRMEALGSIGEGVRVFETVYEKKEDGLYHLRKLALRPNKTIIEWKVDETGGPAGVSQLQGDGDLVSLDMERLLVFTHMGEGPSLLGKPATRPMYRPWWLIDRVSRAGAVAIDRHGAGVPWAKYEGRDVDERRKIEHALMGLHTNERSYMLWNGDVTEWGIKGVEGATLDPVPFMEYQRRDLFLAPLAQFLALGTDSVGSMALSQDHSSFFMMALRYLAREVEDVYNSYLVPRLIGYNWTVAADHLPRVKHGNLDQRNVTTWATAVAGLVGAGIQLPADELSRVAADMLGVTIPEAPDVAADDVADVNDPNAPEGEDMAARAWAGVDLAAKGATKGKKCGNSYVKASYTCNDENPRRFDPSDPSSNNKDLFYDFADTVDYPELSSAEHMALNSYTESGYSEVNSALRGTGASGSDAIVATAPDGGAVETTVSQITSEMDNVFGKAPSLGEPVVTFRGGLVPASAKPGDEFTDAGFVSTSGVPFTAVYSFWRGGGGPEKVVMEIKSPKGTKVVIPDRALRRPTDERIEGEMILNRGTRFRVINRRTEKYPFGNELRDVPIVEVEVIP